MARTPEGRVKDIVKAVLKDELRAWFFFPIMNGMGRAGIPDVIAGVPTTITPDMVGKTVAVLSGIECKAEGNKPTALQRHELEQIRHAGGIAVVVVGEEEARNLARTVVRANMESKDEKDPRTDRGEQGNGSPQGSRPRGRAKQPPTGREPDAG